MAVFQGALFRSVLVIALLAVIVAADTNQKGAEPGEKMQPKMVRANTRPLRPVRASPTVQPSSTVHHHHPAASQQRRTTPVPTVTSVPTQEPEYEQQVLVVKGNPTGEKLNEEIRNAIRALLGPEQSDLVQIRELKSEEELRRIAPGARPVGVRLVQ